MYAVAEGNELLMEASDDACGSELQCFPFHFVPVHHWRDAIERASNPPPALRATMPYLVLTTISRSPLTAEAYQYQPL